MRLTTIKAEKSLADLARKVYKISAADDAAKLAEAERALVRANPHLKDFAAVKPGATVVVPDVEGLKHALPEGVRLKVGPIDADAPLRRSLTSLKGKLGNASERGRLTAERTLEALKSPALKAAIKESPELGARVEAMAVAAKKRAKEIEQESAEQAEVLGRLAKDLDEFIESGAIVAAIKGEAPKPEGGRKGRTKPK